MASYAMMVRDQLMSRVKSLPFFSSGGWHFHTNKSVQIQPQNVPFCGVYLIEEVGVPDGDANVGETRFRTTARYGFSIIVQNNDAEAAENKLDEAMQALNALLADPITYNWHRAGQPSQAAIQSFSRGSRTHQFGSVGENNEYPIAELRYDMTCDLGVITHPPTVTDPFELLHLETRYPLGDDDDVIQVIASWDFWQGETLVSRPHINSTLRVNATVV